MKTVAEIQPGQSVGRYEFLVPIAQGGMASVWAARLKGSHGFSKTVAVKTMLPTVSDEPQFEQMFLDEASIASRIRHPNVAEILDLGEQDELLYLVMEWVDGEPLSAVRWAASKQGGIPLPIGVKVLVDACSGLHAVHELKDEYGEPVGLVHRDISPQNILVGYDGVVKLVDFGVAKAAGRSSPNTSVGEVKGKPPYMSPEQALGMLVDRRTDLFAMGIVLYQVTTGRHPLRGETDIATLQNIISERPVALPSTHVRGYPARLEAIVLRALQRDPSKRFQTASEMGAALEDLFISGDLPRVRPEDVGKYVSQLFGEGGDARRAALREAVRLADQRAFGAQNVLSSRARLDPEEQATTVTRPDLGGTPRGALGSVGGRIAALRANGKGRWRWTLVAALVVALALMVGVFGSRRRPMVEVAGPIAPASANAPENEPALETSPLPARNVEPSARGGLPEGGAAPVVSGPSERVRAKGEGVPKRKVRGGELARTPNGKDRRDIDGAAPLGSTFVPPPLPDPGF